MLTKIIDKETNEDLIKLWKIFNIEVRSKTVKHLCKLYLDKLK